MYLIVSFNLCFHEKWSCSVMCDSLWTVAYQVPTSVEFSRQEYWSGLTFPSPGDLPDLGVEPRSPALQADVLPSEPPGKHYVFMMTSESLNTLFLLCPCLFTFVHFLCVCELCSQIICPLKNLFTERTKWQRSRWVRSTSSLWIRQEYTFRYRSAWQTGVPDQWKRIYRTMQTHQQQPSPWDCSTIPKLQLPSAVPSRGPVFLSRRSSPEPLESEHWFQDPRLPGN